MLAALTTIALACCIPFLEPASAATPTRNERAFYEKIQAHKSRIAKAKNDEAKFAELEEMKSWLGRVKFQKSTIKDKNERFRLQMTRSGLLAYLGHIDRAAVKAGRCEDMRRSIIYSADPHTSTTSIDNESLGEAREALQILDLLCRPLAHR